MYAKIELCRRLSPMCRTATRSPEVSSPPSRAPSRPGCQAPWPGTRVELWGRLELPRTRCSTGLYIREAIKLEKKFDINFGQNYFFPLKKSKNWSSEGAEVRLGMGQGGLRTKILEKYFQLFKGKNIFFLNMLKMC